MSVAVTSTDKVYMTWEHFNNDIVLFQDYLTQYFKTNSLDLSKAVILGLKRGGLPVATTLSNKLNLPMSLVTFQTRDGNDKEPAFLESSMINSESIVIIPDDIYDTGLTFDKIFNYLTNNMKIPNNKIIGLFHFSTKNIYDNKEIKAYRFIRENDGKWIVFPWE